MSVCRISLQPAGRAEAVDLVVCARTPVGVLLPVLIDHVGPSAPPTVACGWRLDGPAGEPLIESLSLHDNGVEDGDTLVLADGRAPTLGPTGRSPERMAAATAEPAADRTGRLRQAACSSAVVASAILVAANDSAVVAGALGVVGACAVSGFALVVRSVPLAAAACAVAAATGFAAVPSGASAANAFLASCAAFATSATLATLWRQPSATLLAVGCLAGLGAGTTGIALFAPLTTAAVGVLLTLAALAVLTAAPKLSAAVAVGGRAETAHVVLTGLVAGGAAGSATGVVTVALQCGSSSSNPLAGSTFCAIIGSCLLLRMRTYVDGPRRWALLVGGAIGLASTVAVVGVTYPGLSAWAVPAVLTAGLVSLRQTWPPSASRAADLLDYAVLAAVAPMACWVMGIYGVARSWMP